MKIYVSDTEIVENTKEQILSVLGLSDEQLGEATEKMFASRERILNSYISDYRMSRINIYVDDKLVVGFSVELPDRDEESFEKELGEALISGANMLTASKVKGFPIADL